MHVKRPMILGTEIQSCEWFWTMSFCDGRMSPFLSMYNCINEEWPRNLSRLHEQLQSTKLQEILTVLEHLTF